MVKEIITNHLKNPRIPIILQNKGIFFFFKPEHWKDMALESALTTLLLHPHLTCQQVPAALSRQDPGLVRCSLRKRMPNTKLGVGVSVI